MLTLLVEKKHIAKAQSELKRIMRNEFDKRQIRTIGYQGNDMPRRMIWTWRGRYWYHTSLRDGDGIPRFRIGLAGLILIPVISTP